MEYAVFQGFEEAGVAAIAERKRPEELTEEDKMALLGRPRLGDITRAQIRIKESKEFKNTVDKLVQRANASILIGTSSWKEQFIEAITVSPGEDRNKIMIHLDLEKTGPANFLFCYSGRKQIQQIKGLRTCYHHLVFHLIEAWRLFLTFI
ncbi:hypothetical protein L9F63_027855, partial [Diploptera punctata]